MLIDWSENYWEPTKILTPPQFILLFKYLENHPEGITSVHYGIIPENYIGLDKYILKVPLCFLIFILSYSFIFFISLYFSFFLYQKTVLTQVD